MKIKLADEYETYMTWMALFFLLLSINLAMEAIALLVDEDAGRGIQFWAQVPQGIGFMTALIAAIKWDLRRRTAESKRGKYSFRDEYVTEVRRRSALVAFVVTVLLVVLLDNITISWDLPVDFYIKLTGFCLLATFSVSFFFFLRNSNSIHGVGEPGNAP